MKHCYSKLLKLFINSGIILPVAFFILIITTVPIGNLAEYNLDEGNELMVTFDYNKGFKLYEEIWLDQTPLFTVMLSWWSKLFGLTITSGRILVLLLSCVLLWTLYRIFRLSTSTPAAIIGIFFLVMSYSYIRLSVSVMRGLPSLTCAVISLYLIILALNKRHNIFLTVASAFFFAISLQIKLWTAIMFPVIVGALFYNVLLNRSYIREWKQYFQIISLWIYILIASFFIIAVIFGFNADQILGTHFRGETLRSFEDMDNLANISNLPVKRHFIYFPIAVFGMIWALRLKRYIITIPAIWFVISLFFLLVHKPVWEHYLIIITLPLTWLTAFGIEGWLEKFKKYIKNFKQKDTSKTIFSYIKQASLFVITFIVIFVVIKYTLQACIREAHYFQYFSHALYNQLKTDSTTKKGYVFTDSPIYAFYTGLPVPPEIAMWSFKRIIALEAPIMLIIRIIHKYQPEYIILQRYLIMYPPEFIEYLEQDYSLKIDNKRYKYFIRLSKKKEKNI